MTCISVARGKVLSDYVCTLIWVLTIGQGLREETFCQLLLHVPFRCALGLPGPIHPTCLGLISIKLSFDVSADVIFVVAGQVAIYIDVDVGGVGGFDATGRDGDR